ncbi:MAG TPA: hypothetical protein VER55_03325 [Ardenticatenaceae bacterium]|nr:hypothetical protein [Ardenticatenaceae bacterium]
MAIEILSDHNCEGQARAIMTALEREGYTALFDFRLLIFEDLGLPRTADDETVWRACQQRGCYLLTGNRSGQEGERSLEGVLRRLVTADHLPVLTIANLNRVMHDRDYRWRCAERLAEIVIDPERFWGVSRLFLPG